MRTCSVSVATANEIRSHYSCYCSEYNLTSPTDVASAADSLTKFAVRVFIVVIICNSYYGCSYKGPITYFIY